MGRAGWILVVLCFLRSCSVWAADVHDARLWRAPDHTRIVFDLTGPAEHSLLVLSNPRRIVLDIQDTNLRTNLADLKLANTPVSLVRSGVREIALWAMVILCTSTRGAHAAMSASACGVIEALVAVTI